LGAVSQEEVFKAMSKAHVFMYTGRTEVDTSRAETQGLVIQEAQYFKLPVVVADVGGVKFGLQNGVTGFLIAENNLEGFVEKIVFLYRNPKVRGEMGEKGYVWVKNNFCSTQIGNKFINLYTISQ
jgi:colanic acid/amylovoran biosynthesis glycosyltransferase